MATLGIGSSILLIIGLLLKIFYAYYPGWRAKRDSSNQQAEIEAFSEKLVSGTDADISVMLSDEFDRVRSETDSDTSK
jgi:hypothetical protein